MASLLQKLPIINLFDWADGEKYTIDDNPTVLTPELAKSDEKTNKAYDERYRQQPKKENSSKGKESKFKEETKVGKSQLNKQKIVAKEKEKTNDEKELAD